MIQPPGINSARKEDSPVINMKLSVAVLVALVVAIEGNILRLFLLKIISIGHLCRSGRSRAADAKLLLSLP
jgi:hypothetical protein